MIDALCGLAYLIVGARVRIKATWHGAGRWGTVLAPSFRHDQWWVVVGWDGEQDPDLFKVAGLEILS